MNQILITASLKIVATERFKLKLIAMKKMFPYFFPRDTPTQFCSQFSTFLMNYFLFFIRLDGKFRLTTPKQNLLFSLTAANFQKNCETFNSGALSQDIFWKFLCF